MYDTELERMITQYQNLIFSICYRIVEDYFEAEDLTQETFLAAYRNYSSFDGENEKAWLARIATNKCLDYKKQAARRQIPTEDAYFVTMSEEANSRSPAGSVSSPEEYLLEKEVRLQLSDCCAQLKPPYDEIAREHFLEEKTADEIAKKHGKNKKTVQTQIYRARELLKRYYRRKEDAG